MLKRAEREQEDLRASSEERVAGEPGGAAQVVAVQGLGFVGAATAVAVANALDENGRPYYHVTGVDLPTASGRDRVQKMNCGLFPFETVDQRMLTAIQMGVGRGNLTATIDGDVYGRADIIIVNVNLDLSVAGDTRTVSYDAFRNAICTLGERVKEGALIIVETTVPPGTCERVVQPIIRECAGKRAIDPDRIHIAHSYERVMPGANYLESITNFWRVYAGLTAEAADRCEAFFSKIINVEKYPLTRLGSTTASEIGKVLENSYRAVNIAFIEEWARFAEQVGVDLYEVIDAIRIRPTHSNIRQPGFGVGGYCLTKDPLFGEIGARELFSLTDLEFPFSSQAVETNRVMPLVTLEKVRTGLGGSLRGKRILLMGISYRQDVGDTRFSPAEVFYAAAEREGALVIPHDPLVTYWVERQLSIGGDLPKPDSFDAVVFAVPHREYTQIDVDKWLTKGGTVLLFDANNVLTEKQRAAVRQSGYKLLSIGRGES